MKCEVTINDYKTETKHLVTSRMLIPDMAGFSMVTILLLNQWLGSVLNIFCLLHFQCCVLVSLVSYGRHILDIWQLHYYDDYYGSNIPSCLSFPFFWCNRKKKMTWGKRKNNKYKKKQHDRFATCFKNLWNNTFWVLGLQKKKLTGIMFKKIAAPQNLLPYIWKQKNL